MAVVLAPTGFIWKDPAHGVDWRKLLHGEQGFELHRPIPAEGEIVGRTRIAALIDKGKRAEDQGEEIGQGREAGSRGHGRLIWGSKGAHLTRICRSPVRLHNFDMQTSGGILAITPTKRPAGDVMSFPAQPRSLTEQGKCLRRLKIKLSVLH